MRASFRLSIVVRDGNSPREQRGRKYAELDEHLGQFILRIS
jgi:hypothetical protein